MSRLYDESQSLTTSFRCHLALPIHNYLNVVQNANVILELSNSFKEQRLIEEQRKKSDFSDEGVVRYSINL